MPFDKETFAKGLASVGYKHQRAKQIPRYRISNFSDLNELLGEGWHFWGLNSVGDYCCVCPSTVEYYLRQRKQLSHFIPGESGIPLKICTPQGYMLYFSFVRGDGIPSDFGKNNSIFT